MSDQTIQWANPTPPTRASNFYAMQAGLDGRVPLSPTTVTTKSTSGTGGGTTGGGGNTCPEASESVTIEGKGNVAAKDIAPGDSILGKSFKTGEDVYRRVLAISHVPCVAWRVVQGHRVSPCESVWDTTQNTWLPAFKVVGSTFDGMTSTKILVSVEADDYDECNYYLTSGTQLLIHNSQILPC
jgi:hypothetical protein